MVSPKAGDPWSRKIWAFKNHASDKAWGLLNGPIDPFQRQVRCVKTIRLQGGIVGFARRPARVLRGSDTPIVLALGEESTSTPSTPGSTIS